PGPVTATGREAGQVLRAGLLGAVEVQRFVVGRVGLDLLVAGHAGTGGDELADDDVLLEAAEAVGAALDGGLGEDPGGLLERRRGQPRVGGQRRLGDAHELRATLGGLLALGDQAAVDVREDPLVDALARQEVRVARLLDRHAAGHLPHDQLDVLVVDRHALVAVHPLHLVDEVLLHRAHALDVQQLLRVAGTLDQRVPRGHLVAVADLEASLPPDRVGVVLAAVADDRDGRDLAVLLVDADDAGRAGQDRLVLRRAALEQLDHPRETAGDVAAGRGHTTGVEG